MAQHGFARDNEFDLVEKTATTARFRLVDNDESFSIYPFHFQFDVLYRLTEQDTLGIAYVVTNTDTHDIYFSVGGHPGFRAPLEEGEKFTDYYINVEPQRKYQRAKLVGPYLDNNLESTFDSRIPLRLRRDDYKDDAIILRLTQNPVSIVLAKLNESHGWRCTSKTPSMLVFDAICQGSTFVAIEPWWGIADTVDADGELRHKFGINTLAPAQTFTGSYTLTFF